MRQKLLYCIVFTCVIAVAVCSSCYDDKGNYTYNEDIHDITVKLKDVYGLRKSDDKMTYTIKPEITTEDGDRSYLSYVWILSNDYTGVEDTVGTSEEALLEFNPDAEDFSYNYSIRLYVTDTRTGGVTMVPSTLEITKPYEYSWVVLHETDGHAALGSVEYVGADAVVSPSAYTDETGLILTGLPICLEVVKNNVSSGWNYSSLSQVFVSTTNHSESGLFNQIDHFKLMASWDNLVHSTQNDDIDFDDVQMSSGDSELLLVSKGNVFRNNYQSPFLFKVDAVASFTGDYYMDKCVAGPMNIGIGYDKIGHRFVKIAFSNPYGWSGYEPGTVYQAGELSSISNDESLGNAANPNAIPSDEQIIGFIPGYRYNMSNPGKNFKFSVYAYSLAPNNVSHVYVFRYAPVNVTSTSYGAPLPYKYTFATPAGITADTPMTSSFVYNNLVFYAVGNRIYKLDISTGTSTLIYSHDDPSSNISSLKMAVEGYCDWAGIDNLQYIGEDTYGHPFCRCLAAGVNVSDGSGELVVLQLNSQGKVDEDHKFPSTQVHKGFGKIKNIGFM